MQILVEPVRLIRSGKAQVYLDPRANQLLERAIAIYGRGIYPTGSGSAGRTKAQQEYYYDQHVNHGGPVAANPNWGRRPHMRFGAIDIDDYNARGAMLAAGWVATTPSEWWHFEHPDLWRSRLFAFAGWPIVTSIYLVSVPEEDTMRLVKRIGEREIEHSVFHPSLHGESDLERGYVLVDAETAVGLARTWENGSGSEKEEKRLPYIGMQAAARVTHAGYPCRRCDPSLPAGGEVDLTEVLDRLGKLELAVNRERKIV